MFLNLLLAATCVVVWRSADVKAGERSEAVSVGGSYDSRTLYVAGDLDFRAEVDVKGDGTWTEGFLKKRREGIYDLKPVKAEKIRLVAKKDAKKVTAVFNLSKRDAKIRSDRTDGKSHGADGPWKNALVKAGKPSAPFVIPESDRKHLTISATNGAKVTVELDITGTGTWMPLMTTASADHVDISRISAQRFRAIADRDCRATVQLEY